MEGQGRGTGENQDNCNRKTTLKIIDYVQRMGFPLVNAILPSLLGYLGSLILDLRNHLLISYVVLEIGGTYFCHFFSEITFFDKYTSFFITAFPYESVKIM